MGIEGVKMKYFDEEWISIGTPAFKRLGSLVRQSNPNGPPDDFVFGRSELIHSLQSLNDTLFFFDQKIGAFGGGIYTPSEDAQEIIEQRLKSNSVFGIASFSYGWNAIASGHSSFATGVDNVCLLYTSPSPRDRQKSRMPSSA